MAVIEELFEFVDGVSVVRYTSAQYAISYNSEIYNPVAMGRSTINFKSELAKQNVEITLPLKNPLAQYLLNNDIESPITVSVIEKDNNLFSTIWQGRLTSVKPNTKQVSLVFESLLTALKRNGLNLRRQRNCPHSLYMRGCYVDANLFKTPATVTTINNPLEYVITEAAGFADGYFTGGAVEDSNGHYRYIEYHRGSVIGITRRDSTIESEFNLNGTVSVSLFAGCDKTMSVCKNRFNNLDNFGGFPYMPVKNPFAGTSLV